MARASARGLDRRPYGRRPAARGGVPRSPSPSSGVDAGLPWTIVIATHGFGGERPSGESSAAVALGLATLAARWLLAVLVAEKSRAAGGGASAVDFVLRGLHEFRTPLTSLRTLLRFS